MQDESFYSLNNSRQQFSFVQEKQRKGQSQDSENDSQKFNQGFDAGSISGIEEGSPEQLNASLDLEFQITGLQTLSGQLPHIPSRQNEQQSSFIFQKKELPQRKMFCKESVRDARDNFVASPGPEHITLCLKKAVKAPIGGMKRYQIVPPEGDPYTKAVYKTASLNRMAVLYEDSQFKVKVNYICSEEKLIIQLQCFNLSKGQYVIGLVDYHISRVSRSLQLDLDYKSKRFSLDCLVYQIEAGELVKIADLCVPVPINLLLQKRFVCLTEREREEMTKALCRRMFIYEIVIKNLMDRAAHARLREELASGVVTVKGTHTLVIIELLEMQGDEVVFRVGAKDQDDQAAADIIQYLCFMLAK